MEPSIWEDLNLLACRIAAAMQAVEADVEQLAALLRQRNVLMEELSKRWRATREVRKGELGADDRWR